MTRILHASILRSVCTEIVRVLSQITSVHLKKITFHVVLYVDKYDDKPELALPEFGARPFDTFDDILTRDVFKELPTGSVIVDFNLRWAANGELYKALRTVVKTSFSQLFAPWITNGVITVRDSVNGIDILGYTRIE